MDRKSSTILDLWTWQCPEWDIARQGHDMNKLEKGWGEMAACLRPLYVRLHAELGDDQFLFCSVRYEHWSQSELRELWTLRVPTNSVYRYLDSRKWNSIVGIATSNNLPNEKAWSGVILDADEALKRIAAGGCNADGVSPLLRVPIPTAWVKERGRYNLGTAEFKDVKYEDLPTSVEKAMEFRATKNESI